MLSLLLLSALTLDAPVNIGARTIFAPQGFDSNDDVEVVLDGYLPSTCYKLTETTVAVDEQARRVTLTPKAYMFEPPCLRILVPYTTVVKIGRLTVGDYDVTVANAENLSVRLPVARARYGTVDDVPYAPVERAVIENASPGHPAAAVLDGRLTSSCTRFDRVDVMRHGNVIEVLPIVTHDDRPEAQCVDAEAPYSQRVALPQDLTPGRYLLHVRSMEGKALNVVFPVYQ